MTRIAVVVLDTLRKDAFDTEFDWLPGRRFENAYSTGSWTVPAHASLFAGKYPSELGVHSKSRALDCPENTLAEVLSESGYTTVSYSCNPYISSAFDFDRGFQNFSGSWRLRHLDPELFNWKRFISETRNEGPTRFLRGAWGCFAEECRTLPSLAHGIRLKLRSMGNSAGQVADDGAQNALDFVEQRDFATDEFLFMNLMEAHAPYVPPQAYRTVELDDRPGLVQTVSGGRFQDADRVRQAYNDCVRYLSDVYQEIFAELSAAFDYIITLGDHGEMFGGHGVWAHTHGVYPELTHIPLSIYSNDAEDPCEVPVSILDVHQTVLRMADVEAESRGQSLITDVEPTDRLSEFMGFTRDDVRSLSEANIPEETIKNYDSEFRGLVSKAGHYGYETVHGFEREQAIEHDLEEKLSGLVGTLQKREVDAEDVLSPQVKDQLEDLGYA